MVPLSAEMIDAIEFYVDGAVSINDLARRDWKRQTDIVKQVFCAARMFADLRKRAVFVDGHLSEELKHSAVNATSVKRFINRRLHDKGLDSRRLIIFDTVTTRAMGGRGRGKARLHFHAVFEVPQGWTRSDFVEKLGAVFGRGKMGQRQFHVSGFNWKKGCSFGGVRATGPIGKLLYAVKHCGAAYHDLELNDGGKRSRRAPACRGKVNRTSSRLAKGVPSHFNKAVVLCDSLSKRLGQEAFESWVAKHRVHEVGLGKKTTDPQKSVHNDGRKVAC